MARSIQRILIAGVPIAAVAIVLTVSAGPAGATLVCPPGVTNPKYCTNVPPVAVTGKATGVGESHATLNGTAGPNVTNGDPTTYYFQYGKTSRFGSPTQYSSSTPPGTIGTCPTGVTNPLYCTTPATKSVSAYISKLDPGTTYHYRIVATNPDGTTYGANKTFTTVSIPPIRKVSVPRTVFKGHKFNVVVDVQVRSKITIKFNGTTYDEGFVNHKVTQKVKAPNRKGRYTVTVKAVDSDTSETVKKQVHVVSPPPPRHHHHHHK